MRPILLIGEDSTYNVNADDFAEVVREYLESKPDYQDREQNLWVLVIEDLVWELWSK